MIYALLSSVSGAASSTSSGSTCYDLKAAYQGSACCGATLTKATDYTVAPSPPPPMSFGTNICAGNKPYHASVTDGVGDGYFYNTNCTLESGVIDVLEQAAANVTAGYQGEMDSGARAPIDTHYYDAGLCPVNVHWHLGSEHYSAGEFDEYGSGPPHAGPTQTPTSPGGASVVGTSVDGQRRGYQCHFYDAMDARFTTEYDWKHCVQTKVGETYEIHWPHSAAGACGTPFQYQSPFYDGVFCRGGIITLSPLNTFQKIGVQGQVFTIVNDEAYYYPDLIRGMLVDGNFGADIAKYTGSTTGTSRDNEMCSRYTPITWQVDRKCHLISASSFDKMCADMKAQQDDMSMDLHPHGSRPLVSSEYAANNQGSLRQ